MVGQQTLDLFIGVRIPAGQQDWIRTLQGCSGSNPYRFSLHKLQHAILFKMTDTLEVSPYPVLQEVIHENTFSDGYLFALQLFAHHVGDIKMEINHEGDLEVAKVRIHDEEVIIDVPSTITNNDLVSIYSSLEQKFPNEKPGFKRFAKKLKDGAILMAQEPALDQEESKMVVEYLYELGTELENISTSENHTMIPLLFDQIQSQTIQPPEGSESSQYVNEVYLFLLGKGAILGSTDDSKLKDDPHRTFYNTLYSSWKNKKGINEESIDVQNTFDQELLKRKKLLIRLLTKYLPKSIESGRGKTALKELSQQAVNSIVDESFFEAGSEYIKKQMFNPEKLENIGGNDEEGELLRIRLEILTNQSFDNHKLFSTAEALIADMELDEKRPLTVREKMTVLWDMVQAYKFQNTFSINRGIYDRAFECNIRAFLLANLYEKFLGENVVILGDNVKQHTRLIVIDKTSYAENSPEMYFVDPAVMRDSIDITNTIHKIGIVSLQDKDTKYLISNELKKNSNSALFRTKIERVHKWYQGHHTIGNWKLIYESNLWNNIGRGLVKDKEIQRECYKKSVQLNYMIPENWFNLAIATESLTEKRTYFLKAYQLDKDNYECLLRIASTYTMGELKDKDIRDLTTKMLTEFISKASLELDKSKNDNLKRKLEKAHKALDRIKLLETK